MRILALSVLGLTLAVAMPAHAAAPLTRIQVVADEFDFRLSRVRVPPGVARIELVNFGEDEHDLVLQRVGSSRINELANVLPGDRGRLTLKLSAGRYRLWCSVADHAGRGMRAELRVTQPLRARRGARSASIADAHR